MKFTHWIKTRACLAGGLLLATIASPLLAQDQAAGVVRISKSRKAPAVQQTGFIDVIHDAGEVAEEAMEGLAAPSRPGTPVSPVSLSASMAAGSCGPACNSGCETFGSWTYCDGSCRNNGCCNGDGCCLGGCECGGDCDCDGGNCRFGRWGRRDCDSGVCPVCGGRHGCHGNGLLAYLHCKFGYFCPTGNGGKGSPFFGCYSRVYPQDVNYFDGRDGQLYSAQGYGVPVAVPLAPTVGHAYNYGWGIPSSRLTPISRMPGQ